MAAVVTTAEPAESGGSVAEGADARRIDPEMTGKLAAFRQHLHGTFAQVVMAMMAAPRYRHCSLAELEPLVLDPLLRDRIAIARAKDGDADGPIAGIAVWATVSAEVDAKIREQIKAGVFPLRLKAEDWASGPIAWLIDVIARTDKQAGAVVANFGQVVKEGRLNVHPIVRSLVPADLLEKGNRGAPEQNRNGGQLFEGKGKDPR